MKTIKKIFKWTIGIVLLFVLYIAGCLIQGTVTDYQPEEIIKLEIKGFDQAELIKDSILTFLNWNVGYGGLGGKSNFFYDAGNPFFFSGGRMVRSPKDFVEENIKGIGDFIAANQTDFVLLQEVDQNSKRSYFINQHDNYLSKLPDYTSTFTLNFKVSRVPLPIMEPWNVMGKMQSGLSTYSKYRPQKARRYQFPGSYGWPDYIFHLDRCMSVQRFSTDHPKDKELLVINTHNSAYDNGGLKQQEMDYFRKFVLAEYKKGNYIIVGGDWNQSPPNLVFDAASKAAGIETDSSYQTTNIKADFLPKGWQWVYDPSVPTNRNMTDKLEYGKTAAVLIDYYLVSPNIEVLKIEGKNLKFAYSDHNPVLMEVKLKGLRSDVVGSWNE